MEKTKISHIGSQELLHFTEAGIFNVPAKIDTGADSCAVWASNISERDGVLRFCLFSPGSAFYTGDVLETTDYKTTSVKNSFGVKEPRHVVKLRIQIGERKLKIRFTLADRSRNHFPILLGKNFLKNRFLVDVSAGYLLSPREEVAKHSNLTVLSSRTDEDSQKFFAKVQKGLTSTLNLVDYRDLIFHFGENPSITTTDGTDIAESRMIYLKNYKKFPEHAAAIASYANYKSVVIRDEELLGAVSSSKLSEMMKLSVYDIPVPNGPAMSNGLFIKKIDEVVEELGLPLVLKDVFSDRGKNNYLVTSRDQMLDLLKKAPKECFFVAQEYIENDGFDRIIVLGKKPALMVRRTAVAGRSSEKSHLNKPRGGVNAKMVNVKEISATEAVLAIKAAEVMKRQVAGVDLIQAKNSKKWYILEVNYNPDMVGVTFEDERAKLLAKYLASEMERW